MPRISVMICCANVSETIEAACRSAAWADELVVVDSGSADGTGEIAQRFATRYVVEPWRGYREQKRFGVSLCRNDWVLVLDGDEECSPELADEIARLSDADLEGYGLFLMRRRNYIMGRYVRAFSPDWQNRLLHRQRCYWTEAELHEKVVPCHPSRVARLKGWLWHRRCSRAGFADYFDGHVADSRLALSTKEMLRRGKRCTWMDLVLRPPIAFVKFYVLKGGVLDGKFGLLIAQRAAVAVQLKYAALWAAPMGYLPGAPGPDTSSTSCSPPSSEASA